MWGAMWINVSVLLINVSSHLLIGNLLCDMAKLKVEKLV